MRNILIPVDVGEPSKSAVAWYINNFRRDDDHVLLIHVVEPKVAAESVDTRQQATLIKILTSNMELSVEKGSELQKTYREIFEEHKIPFDFQLCFGSKPVDSLLEIIRSRGITCVVMASRGRNAIERTLLGTVSDQVVHHANVPVIVIPPSTRRQSLFSF
ncbi:hypothetical protein FBUS_02210 [Fasciolopsis buskii]|uniref:UspA domain-containing protein n=1 Tax=Fasciolopsis buskii TaxID=27845 RepID=A0A8E0RV51_9TREM|nr:hypothetical protein FBUS_02210 [Fasciolopsis buski]